MAIKDDSTLERIRALGSNLVERFSKYEAMLIPTFEHAPVPMALINGDKYVMVNDAFSELLGFPKNEIEETSWKMFVHPDDLAQSVEAAKTMDQGPLINFKNRLRRKDGAFIEVDWSATARHSGVSLAIARPIS